MAAKYWIKLYHEILDDAKMGRLPVNLKWRFVEFLLLAGELDEGGYLPTVPDMAWRLRADEATVTRDLGQLAMCEMTELKDDNGRERWYITHFSERQKASPAAERMREMRKRKRKEPKEKENRPDTDIDTYRAVTPVTNRNSTVTKKEHIYISPDPEPIAAIKTALATTTKTPLWASTEEEYDQAAYLILGHDCNEDDVKAFGEWWKTNSYYDKPGKPYLKSLVGSFPDFLESRNGHKNGAAQPIHDPQFEAMLKELEVKDVIKR